jgi:3D (Asp-Asp-Asp) domain-containing protein
VVKKDGSLPKGTQVVQSEGAAGRLLKVWQSVVVDGKPGERTLTASRVMSKPKTRVIRQGTAEQKSTAPAVVAQAEEPAAPSTSSQGSSKPAATNSERSRRPASGRQLTVSSTAYSPAQPGLSSRTATGRRATKGVIAVDPRVIPLGTRVYVPGYGNAIAADTGGAIKGNKIDVCFDSVAEARAWGRRTVTITILD